MLQNWFILLPEICLGLFFPVAKAVSFFSKEKSSKTFFLTAQFFLSMSLAFSILFYNKSVFPELWQKTSVNTLFTTFSMLMAWAWFYLSSKWYLTKNRESYTYYIDGMALILGYEILASATSLSIFCLCVLWIFWFTRALTACSLTPEKEKIAAKLYTASALFFSMILVSSVAFFYHKTGSLSYEALRAFFAEIQTRTFAAKCAVAGIISVLLFLMAAVPFHIWFLGVAKETPLPTSGFLIIVPLLIYPCVLINLILRCFAPFSGFLFPLLEGVAVVSILTGAISANNEQNLRRLTASITIFCIGVVLMGLNDFSKTAIIASFAYILVAALSLGGICTVFLGMKSRGDYLTDLAAISGFRKSRPYMSAALLIFVFSLAGLCPTVGFLGYLSILNNFVLAGAWPKTALIITGALFIAAAGLRLIRTIYFEEPSHRYDRADKAIYICLFLNMVFIVLSLFNPSWLMHDILIILGGLS